MWGQDEVRVGTGPGLVGEVGRSLPTNHWYALSDQYGQIIYKLGLYLTLI
mgnify:CR=1 FL=1